MIENKRIKALMIIGQTCSGKEKLSLKLAEYLKTDIISMDSMKIYKDMDIGTAKASIEDRKKITHHQLDIVTPEDNYNVSDYIRETLPIALDLTQKNKLPLFSGGTSLYAKSLFSGLFEIPEIPQEIKKNIETYYDLDKEKAYQMLQKVDPLACKKIHLNDRQRVTRALEVFVATKKPITSFQSQFSTISDTFEFLAIGIRWPRNELHNRIAKRVHWMIDSGLENEVKKIQLKYQHLAASPAKAVGYHELNPYFKGECTKEEAIERIIINTRQLCKHQMTWMRKLPIQWIDINAATPTSDIFDKSLQIIQNSFLKNQVS